MGTEKRNTEVSSGTVINDRFEWDDAKAQLNEKKHGVTFELAEQIFDDPLQATRVDRHHSGEEIATSRSAKRGGTKYWSLRNAERNGRRRLISDRRAKRKEKRDYMDKPLDIIEDVDDLLPEYDFKGAVRGKFYRPGRSIIRMTIDEDVARYYPTSELINAALRQLIAEGRAPEPRDE